MILLTDAHMCHAGISNHIHYKMWDNITYMYLTISKLQQCNHWRLGLGKYFIPNFAGHMATYLSMLGLKLAPASKRVTDVNTMGSCVMQRSRVAKAAFDKEKFQTWNGMCMFIV